MSAITPLQSMTGFVSHEATGAHLVGINVELRSLNSRYLELHFRLPDELRHAEAGIRKQIAAQCERGKIDIRISLRAAESAVETLDEKRLQHLLDLQQQIQLISPAAAPFSVNALVDRCTGSNAMQWSEALEAEVLSALTAALTKLVTARQQEGAALKTVLLRYTAETRAIVTALKADLVDLQARLLQELQHKAAKVCGQLQVTPPADLAERLQAEVMHYVINGDVEEELTRLTVHLTALEQLIEDGGAIGKKADFLMQELNREANTLGAKATVLDISHAALALKVKIDQMREQFQNIQ